VEIVGVLASADHTRCTLFVRPARSTTVHGPFVLPIDMTPRKLVWRTADAADGGGSSGVASRMPRHNEKQSPPPQPQLCVEVAQRYESSALDRLPAGASLVVTDRVGEITLRPRESTVASLKEAIKAAFSGLHDVDAAGIIVRDPTGEKVLEDTTELLVERKYIFWAPGAVEIIVTDGKSTFGVKPAEPTVASLKKAIKVACAVRLKNLDAGQIIIKDPTGEKVLEDTTELLVERKYIFWAPGSVEIIVTDGKRTFGVKPAEPTVASLKEAIKAAREPVLDHIAADQIIIKEPTRADKPLDDRDEVRPDVKYVFEVPSTK
jgi:hypothetical protein